MDKNEDAASEGSILNVSLYESVFSFLLAVQGYYINISSDVIDSKINPSNLFNIQSILPQLTHKKLQLTFNQLYVEGLCDTIKSKFSQFSINRRNYIANVIKQKNEVRIIEIKKDIESNMSSPKLNSTKHYMISQYKKKLMGDGLRSSHELKIGDYASIQARKKNS